VRNVLVIGGTLFIGKELVRRLGERGDRITILHRGRSALPDGVEEIRCDRNDVKAVRKALGGRSFDVVFDNVYDWERGTTEEQVAAAPESLAQCGRYVFLSSVGAYVEGLDRREDDPLGYDSPIPYVRNKARSERRLFRLHRERGLAVATLRPPFVYGPENPFYREAFFWDRLRKGRPILVPEDGSTWMQFVYVKDLVEAMLHAAEAPDAAGQAYNIANAAPVTQLEAVRALGAAAGLAPQIMFVPRERLLAAGGQVFRPPFYFGDRFDLPPITQQTEKARRELGFEPTSFAAGLAETWAWYRQQPESSRQDQALEVDTTAGQFS
jgi:2'-hydroxyisoflavone reductase